MTNPKSHYPDQRHTNVFNALSCDGHTSALEPSDIMTNLFLANGNIPTYP